MLSLCQLQDDRGIQIRWVIVDEVTIDGSWHVRKWKDKGSVSEVGVVPRR